jgi:hypothetical protein
VVLTPRSAAAQIDTPTGPIRGAWGVGFEAAASPGYGVPQKLYVDLTASLAGAGANYSAGPYLTWAPGKGGSRAVLGYMYAKGLLGIRGGPTLLSTTRTTWRAPEKASYIGLEIEAPYRPIMPRVSLYRRRGAGDDHSMLVSFGVIAYFPIIQGSANGPR